jgi:tetratricopeptide (TPR) repeat protein
VGHVAMEVRMQAVRILLTFAFAVSLTACTRTSSPEQSLSARLKSSPTNTGLDRSCVVAMAASHGRDDGITKLQQDLRDPRSRARAAEQLGYRFIAQARLSNDPGFYKVAEEASACLESIAPEEPAALLLRGHVLHQMHRFGEAEAIARHLVTRREFVLDFGLLGDVLMEQGRVADAAEAYQKMIDLKPFYQSYTRAAHLRWTRGDLTGAIAMMNSAVKAASLRDSESVAWAYSRLAIYELQRGRLAEAGRMAEASLHYVPDYAAALLARGRIELAQEKYTDAIQTLERAVRLNPLPEYQWTLADALRLVKRNDEAAALEQQLIREGVSGDPRTLSLFLSTRGEDGRRAVDLARRELGNRSDVFTLDALAWALASTGQFHEASALMARALAEGTQDGRLFLHASAIASADGRSADAARWARKAHKFRFTLLPSELGVLRKGLVPPPQA